ncbi:hypothetical protein [Neobacillus massiliamazoniensis]|uniref:Uncharacterized protein n=1 Tax=Neobacillus massiliamazoniensis TaxID=1499688 RepID=A0A0U1P2P1_9BACI|nr:hypothetical protein [Neobacillus massiliamazoniensis]CRK84535.1 hypothetical protein BN000_04567 [Neobacillus massiliamazoniensis]
MDTKILYYKIYESDVKPVDYVDWAIQMLMDGCSAKSLNILSSLKEPLNIFEVEDYFMRASNELNIIKPIHEECAKYYIWELLIKIINDENTAIDIAYKIYEVVREHSNNDELSIWYEISEKIDDFRYGDNTDNVSEEELKTQIVEEAKKQLKET